MKVAVTRLRPVFEGVNGFGEPVLVDVQVDDLPDLAHFAPSADREVVTVGRASHVQQPALYFRDAFPDITHSDSVRVAGVEYSVDADPERWDPAVAGGPGGLVVWLRKA